MSHFVFARTQCHANAKPVAMQQCLTSPKQMHDMASSPCTVSWVVSFSDLDHIWPLVHLLVVMLL